jgi:hypothetical protein
MFSCVIAITFFDYACCFVVSRMKAVALSVIVFHLHGKQKMCKANYLQEE